MKAAHLHLHPHQAHHPALQAQAPHQAHHQAAHQAALHQAHHQALQAQALPQAQVRNSAKNGLNPHGLAIRAQLQPKIGTPGKIQMGGVILLFGIALKNSPSMMTNGREPKLEAAVHLPPHPQAHHQAPQAAQAALQAAPQAAHLAAHLQAHRQAPVHHLAQARKNEVNNNEIE